MRLKLCCQELQSTVCQKDTQVNNDKQRMVNHDQPALLLCESSNHHDNVRGAGAAAAHNSMCAGACTFVRAFCAGGKQGKGEKDEGKAKTAQTSAQVGKS